MIKVLLFLFVTSLSGFGFVYADAIPVPLQETRVTDLTQTLEASQRQALESRLALFQQTKGAQIAILIVPTTQPETIEQYALRVAETWQLGRKKIDDGALLLVAIKDRSLRIEVGYGLEGALTDATAKRIIAETITPYFQRGDIYGGLDAGVGQMMKVIQGEPLPPPQKSASRSSWMNPQYIIFAIVLVVMLGNSLRAVLGRPLGAALTGGVIGGIAWFLAVPIFLAIIAGIIAFLSVLFNSGRGGTGGWGTGGYGGGGLGGGSSSGGGFSGGGGGFGGGGASGKW